MFRDSRRMNENKKLGWKVYCSQKCLGLSRTTRKEFICARKGCGKSFTRIPSDSNKSKSFYCSLRCAALVNNQLRERVIRICPNCKGEFIGDNKYCSKACIPERGSKYSGKTVIELIMKFFKKNERIPVRREMYSCYRAARKYFGTWNKAVEAAGFKPNPVIFAKKYIAKDGDKCDSLAEKIIDDYLSKRDIKHTRNFPYPGNDGFTVDFRVGKIWIEFFGLSGQLKRYDELMKRKLKLAKKLGINLIKIYPKDLFPKSKLSDKISNVIQS